jgi:hypothetical protein
MVKAADVKKELRLEEPIEFSAVPYFPRIGDGVAFQKQMTLFCKIHSFL